MKIVTTDGATAMTDKDERVKNLTGDDLKAGFGKEADRMNKQAEALGIKTRYTVEG